MRCFVVWTGIALFLAAAAPAAVAAAAPTWSVAAVDLPGAATESDSGSAPSCWAPERCAFVGDYVTSGHDHSAYLGRVRGAVQSTVESPAPADAATGTKHDVLLSDVSCPQAGACVAVGRYLTKAGSFAGLLVRQTLAGWTATRAPIPHAANVDLTDVSCNAAQCVAIGTYDADSAVILERTGPGQWTAPSITPPSGAGEPSGMADVSCPSSGPCYVVGEVGPEGGPRQVFFYPSGSGWRGVYLPVPQGADPQRMAVGELSCPSPGNCALLTTWEDTARTHTGLSAETFDDGVLSTTAVDVAAPVLAVRYPRGIDCVVATWCVGVAAFAGTDQTSSSLLVRRTAQGWSAMIAPSPGGKLGSVVQLADVSCRARGACAAVGALDQGGTDHPLAATLSRGTWTAAVLDAPIPSSRTKGAALTGVDCVGTGCVATGYFDRRPGPVRNAMIARTH